MFGLVFPWDGAYVSRMGHFKGPLMGRKHVEKLEDFNPIKKIRIFLFIGIKKSEAIEKIQDSNRDENVK